MELEEMETAWAQMSVQVEKQKKLTDKLILEMTRARYERGINKVRIPEISGSIGCIALGMVILFNYSKFGTGFLLACAIVSAAILLLLPILSLSALQKMKKLPLSELNYKELLTWHAKGKQRFLSVQKLSIYLTCVLMLAGLPVFLKLMSNKELSFSTWLWFSVGGLLIFAVFASFVYRYYSKTISSLDNLLNDLEDNT